MHIKLTNIRHNPIGDVLCDICCLPVELDEDCSYLFPQEDFPNLEPLLIHNPCYRRASAPLLPEEGWPSGATASDGRGGGRRLRGYWATLSRPRTILESIINSPRRSRYPQLDALLNDLKEHCQKRQEEKRP